MNWNVGNSHSGATLSRPASPRRWEVTAAFLIETDKKKTSQHNRLNISGRVEQIADHQVNKQTVFTGL